MSVPLTADRVRTIINGVKTEKTLLARLKAHRIRYTVQPAGSGIASVFIACRTGKIRIYRTASRTAPYAVQIWTTRVF